MYEGARSGTPEQAIADGVFLAEAGFELIDIGAVAARSGPPVAADSEAAALIPAIEGLAERLEIPITADTYSPRVARLATAAGAAAIRSPAGFGNCMYSLKVDRRCCPRRNRNRSNGRFFRRDKR